MNKIKIILMGVFLITTILASNIVNAMHIPLKYNQEDFLKKKKLQEDLKKAVGKKK